jgi:hypothetical protein
MGRRLRIEQAHHEAAHCVAAIAQGLCVRWVTLAPVDNHAAGTHVERAIFSAADNPDAQIEALKIDITVALAGACAQMKLRPTLKLNQEWGDFQLSAAWASLATFLASGMNIAEVDPDGLIELSEDQQAFADNLLDECEESAHQIVEERWAEITTIAEALLDRTMLNADDLDPLIDKIF